MRRAAAAQHRRSVGDAPAAAATSRDAEAAAAAAAAAAAVTAADATSTTAARRRRRGGAHLRLATRPAHHQVQPRALISPDVAAPARGLAGRMRRPLTKLSSPFLPPETSRPMLLFTPLCKSRLCVCRAFDDVLVDDDGSVLLGSPRLRSFGSRMASLPLPSCGRPPSPTPTACRCAPRCAWSIARRPTAASQAAAAAWRRRECVATRARGTVVLVRIAETATCKN